MACPKDKGSIINVPIILILATESTFFSFLLNRSTTTKAILYLVIFTNVLNDNKIPNKVVINTGNLYLSNLTKHKKNAIPKGATLSTRVNRLNKNPIIIKINTLALIYLFNLLNAPDTRPANEYTPIYKADTMLVTMNPRPTITPDVAPKVDPPIIAAININTVANTHLIDIPKNDMSPIPIILNESSKLKDTTSSGLIYILLLLLIKNFIP